MGTVKVSWVFVLGGTIIPSTLSVRPEQKGTDFTYPTLVYERPQIKNGCLKGKWEIPIRVYGGRGSVGRDSGMRF